MTELTIQFNYVQDCIVLLREDFLKYTGMILPKEITKGHAEDMYYNLGVNEWNRDDRPNGVRIGANLNLILVMIEDMIDFLYGI